MVTRDQTARVIRSIQVKNVTRLYGATAALRGVNAQFDAGSVSLIEGANGSGKSTLMSLLSTASPPTRGRVTWAPLGTDRLRARPHIGWLGHEAAVYPDLSGLENLRFAASLYGLTEDRVKAMAERLRLGRYAERPVRTMSRGQRQRIALGRALIHSPDVLLLDEPTTGLDAPGRESLAKLVAEEAQSGAIVVMIAHHRALAEALGARVLKMERGKLLETSEG